jgi:hypothetical protein
MGFEPMNTGFAESKNPEFPGIKMNALTLKSTDKYASEFTQ